MVVEISEVSRTRGINEAFETMCVLVESGVDFSIAHEEATINNNLTEQEAKDLIAWYDEIY
jgi:hypothetical protein